MTISAARLIVLSQSMLTKANNPNSSMKSENCRGCNKKITAGSSIITKKSSGYVKWYHENCAKMIKII